MEREFVAKIDGRGVDDDAGSILIYRLGGQVSLACCPNPGARTAESARCPEPTISASFCTGWVRADMAVRAPFDLGNTPSRCTPPRRSPNSVFAKAAGMDSLAA